MSRFRSIVKNGLILVSGGAGVAAVSAYLATKHDTTAQSQGLLLLNEVLSL